MKKISKILIYVIVGILSFGLFLFLSFPYNILKETLSIQITQTTGLTLNIKDLGPSLPFGLHAEGIEIRSGANDKTVELKRLKAKINMLNLLIGRIKVDVAINDATNGELDLGLGFGIFDLLSKNFIPSSVTMNSDKFTFGNFIELALKARATNPNTNPFIKPILEKITVTGKLNAQMDFSLNTSDFSRSNGTMNISLMDASIDFDPSMQIPTQKFESAVIKANSQGGTFSFDPASRIKTKDLDIALVGKILEKSKVEQSILDMEIRVQLFKELKNTFGVVVNAIAGKDADGNLNIKISGPVIPGPDIKIL